MTASLDDLYLPWLYAQVGNVRVKNPAKTHWSLLKQLYSKEFIWFVPNDDNRAEEGRELREEFIDSEGLADVDQEWLDLGCSILEMLIALSRRLAFEAEGEPRDWFWHLLNTLGLDTYTDKSRYSHSEVEAKLDMINDRTYDPNGHGGLFPLRRAHYDQRKVEIWYQMCEYILQDS